MPLTCDADYAMDRLANTSLMWEESEKNNTKRTFQKLSKPKKITISMKDLNQLIFRRNQYNYDFNNGGGHHYKGIAHGHSVSIHTHQKGGHRTITATLENAQGVQKINLSFDNKNGQCTLRSGKVEKNGTIESLENSKRLSEVLLCIYKHVRLASDPKWATQYLIEKEAREVAAQTLETESFPKIINNNSQLIFKKPNIGACGHRCGQSTCPAKVMIKTLVS